MNLVNHFLIAMPSMVDPNFSKTLTYICEHNANGALGIIVNRPIDMDMANLFERVAIQLKEENDNGLIASPFAGMPIYFGGPVQINRGFVLHRPAGVWQATLKVTPEIALTSSRDILLSMGESGEPANAIITLGHAGWAAGQLEWELGQNTWLTVNADPKIIFDLPPEERFQAAIRLLGFDLAHLSSVAGHA
ncbi:MAG: YqgE/AlgH family protein [Rhodocyclaceae bacterium]|nr:YqgE/AlgH family protein [Rhodocyclaceae bacterium]